MLEDRVTPATIYVTSTDGNLADGSASNVTLPWAVTQSNDTIEFASSLSGATISLSGTLAINTNVAIVGLGANQLTISGGGSSGNFGDINVGPGVTATISGVTIDNGYAPGGGGGINNSGTLTLANAAVSNNSDATASPFGDGGGIYNSGTMSIYDTTVNNNLTFSNGGGIYNASTGTLSIANSTIYGNSFYTDGGGIDNAGSLILSNSTITGNTGVTAGSFNTVHGYDGGGIYNTAAGKVTMSNTIVAGNAATESGPDIDGSVTAYFSLIGKTTNTTISDSSNTTNILNSTAGLATTLANNGGTTKTVALQHGSPAIGTGGAITTVADPIGMNDTTITLTNAATIAVTPGAYTITIGQEEMLVTGVSGNTLTVQRGYDSTTQAAYTAGTAVYLATDQRGEAAASPPDIGAFSIPTPLNIPVLTVTSADGNLGDGSASDITLPYAVSQNAATIEFAASLSGQTIVLNGTLDITTNVDIVGLGANQADRQRQQCGSGFQCCFRCNCHHFRSDNRKWLRPGHAH